MTVGQRGRGWLLWSPCVEGDFGAEEGRAGHWVESGWPADQEAKENSRSVGAQAAEPVGS